MRREDSRPRRADSSDVAALAGVSRSTVSKVLNGREIGRIPADTCERVLQAARELNYVRNNRAHALVTGRTQRIGVALSRPEGFRHLVDYHREVLAGIFEGAVECNYNLVFHAVHHPDWQSLYTDIIGGSADGVLLIGSHQSVELGPALIESGFPTVFISHDPTFAMSPHSLEPQCHVIDCDNIQGGYLAAKHLIELGHRHLLCVSGKEKRDWQTDRLRGVEKAVLESSQSCKVESLLVDSFEEIERKLPEGIPDAIILIHEQPRGPELVTSLLQYGLRIPEDISIVNFNSTEECIHAAVPLTSVWQPLHTIGLRAVHHLTRLLTGEDIEPGVVRYPVRLDVRASTTARRL